VVDAAQLRRTARDAVVRPLTRAADRPCARPACPAPARATLTFRYADREVRLVRLADEPSPQAYDLCADHASRTVPPQGWELRDQRPEEERAPDVPPATPADPGGDRTVAVLAAALRQVPDPTPARGDRDHPTEVGHQPPAAVSPNDTASAAEDETFRRPRGALEPPALSVVEPSEDAASPVLGGDPAPEPSSSAEAAPPLGPRPKPVLATRAQDPPAAPDPPAASEPEPSSRPSPDREPAADW
jgi:hypothetical protein